MAGKSDLLLVFINLLCHANQDGLVDVHWKVVAFETGLTEERVKNVLVELESPDPESRRRNDEGRRIERMDPDRSWGWEIINYKNYSAIVTRQHRNKYMREYKKERKKLLVTNGNNEVTSISTSTSTDISSSSLPEGDVGGDPLYEKILESGCVLETLPYETWINLKRAFPKADFEAVVNDRIAAASNSQMQDMINPYTYFKNALSESELRITGGGSSVEEVKKKKPGDAKYYRELAVEELTNRLWDLRDNSEEFKRLLSSANVKYKDFGHNVRKQSVVDEALDYVEGRKQSGWGLANEKKEITVNA